MTNIAFRASVPVSSFSYRSGTILARVSKERSSDIRAVYGDNQRHVYTLIEAEQND